MVGLETYARIKHLDVMITFKKYLDTNPIPFIFNKKDPRIEWINPNRVFTIYGNYSIMEIKTNNQWKPALVRERAFNSSIHVDSYSRGFGSRTPVMCFLSEEDAKRTEQNNIILNRETSMILKEQNLIRIKDLPKVYQIYTYD